MKKLTVLSIVVGSLLLIGCGDETKETTTPVAEKATEATTPTVEKTTMEKVKEATANAVEKTKEVAKEAEKVAGEAIDATKEVAKEAKEAVSQKVTEVKEAVAQKVAEVSAVDTKACGACHGAEFEKKAMNVSKIVKDMSKEEIITALKGYKDGSYGGNMKGLMKGQLATFDDAKIEAVASQIAK
jgi:cytochrome c553